MPYNPGITYDASPLARGVGSFVASIAAGIQKRKEEQKQRARTFDALLNYGDATGLVPKDAGKTMSLEQLEGVIKAKVYQQDRERVEQNRQLVAAQIKAMNDAAAQREAMAGVGRDLGASLDVQGELAETPGFEGVPSPEFSQLLIESVRRNPRAFGVDLVDAIARLRAGEQREMRPAEFDVKQLGSPIPTAMPGFNAVPVGPRQVQMVPQADDRTRGRPASVDGKVVGYWFGDKFVERSALEDVPPDAKITQAVDDTGNPVRGVYRWVAGNKAGWLREPAVNPWVEMLSRNFGIGGGVAGPAPAVNPKDPLGLFAP